MTDIFLSYAREDIAKARQLASALSSHGWSVFWDRTIPTGQSWRAYIGGQLDQARCVIVAWTKSSIVSQWVQEEADAGLQKGVLFPVLFETVIPPIGFRSVQAEDFSKWTGSAQAECFRKLVSDAAALLTSSAQSESNTIAAISSPSIASEQRLGRQLGSYRAKREVPKQSNLLRAKKMKLPPAGKKASATDSSVENERSARTALFWNDGKASKLCLPVELFEDNSLEKLTIGYYDEVEIPDAIRKLTNLKILEIHNSNLISIPEAIYDLTSLEELSLTNGSTYWAPGGINEITEVSPKILQLKNLKRLELDPYYIKVPPRDVVVKGLDAIRNYFLSLE